MIDVVERVEVVDHGTVKPYRRPDFQTTMLLQARLAARMDIALCPTALIMSRLMAVEMTPRIGTTRLLEPCSHTSRKLRLLCGSQPRSTIPTDIRQGDTGTTYRGPLGLPPTNLNRNTHRHSTNFRCRHSMSKHVVE